MLFSCDGFNCAFHQLKSKYGLCRPGSRPVNLTIHTAVSQSTTKPPTKRVYKAIVPASGLGGPCFSAVFPWRATMISSDKF